MADFDTAAVSPSKPAAKGIPHAATFAAVLSSFSKTYSYRFDEALRHNPQNALAMRRDCYLMALLQERLLPSATMDWAVVPEDPKDEHQKEVASVFTKLIKKIPRWLQFKQSLLQAVWYGKYGVQMHWGPVNVGGRKYWSVVDHDPVNGDKIAWGWDKIPAIYVNGSVINEYPSAWIKMTDRVPALSLCDPAMRERFAIHAHEVDDADFFEGEMGGAALGIGLRSRIYWAQWLRDELLSWAVTTMERAGANGITVFWYEANNPTAKAAAENAARKYEEDNVLVMPVSATNGPATHGIENIPGNVAGLEHLQNMIQGYFEGNMERLIVGQSMSSKSEGSGLGNTGAADFQADTKYQLVRYDSRNVDETITRDLLGPMVRHNYPGCPFELHFKSSVPDPGAVNKLNAVQTAISMGITFAADSIRELTGMPKPAEDDEIVGGPQPGMPGAPVAGGDPSQGGGEGDPFAGMDLDSDSPFSDSIGGGDDPQESTDYSREVFGWAGMLSYAAPGQTEWTASVLKAGPRKGQAVFRNIRTGAVRDKPPQVGGGQPDEGSEHQPSTAGVKEFKDLTARAETAGVKPKAVGAHADEIFRQYRDGGMDPKEAAAKAVEETGSYIDGMSDPKTRAKMVGARDTWTNRTDPAAAIGKLADDGHLSHLSPKHRREAIEHMAGMSPFDVMKLHDRDFPADSDRATLAAMSGQAFDGMPSPESTPFRHDGRYALVTRQPRGTHIGEDGEEAGEEEDHDTKLFNDAAESGLGKLPLAGGTLMGSRVRLVPLSQAGDMRGMRDYFDGTHMRASPVNLGGDPSVRDAGMRSLWDATEHLPTQVSVQHVPRSARSSTDLGDENETLDMRSVPRYRRVSREWYLKRDGEGGNTELVHRDKLPDLTNIKKEHLSIVGTDADKDDAATKAAKMSGAATTREQLAEQKRQDAEAKRAEVRERLSAEHTERAASSHDEHRDAVESDFNEAGSAAHPNYQDSPEWAEADGHHDNYRDALEKGDYGAAGGHLDRMRSSIDALAGRADESHKAASARTPADDDEDEQDGPDAEEHAASRDGLKALSESIAGHRKSLDAMRDRHNKALERIQNLDGRSRFEKVMQYIRGPLRAMYEWVPWTIKSGPRKGATVQKNTESGSIRDGQPGPKAKAPRAAAPPKPAKAPKSATVGTAHALIKKHTTSVSAGGTFGKAITPKRFREIADHLGQLTHAEIRQVKKELGIRVGGPNKSVLVEKLTHEATREITSKEKWKREARSQGIPPEHMAQMANAIRDIDRRQRTAIVGAIRYARERYRDTVGKNLNRSDRAFREGDYSTLKGWDEIAEGARESFPDAFPNDHDESVDHENHLHELVRYGVPTLQTWDEYYRAALKAITRGSDYTAPDHSVKPAKRSKPKAADEDDDYIPFSRSDEVSRGIEAHLPKDRGERRQALLSAWLELEPEQMAASADRVADLLEDSDDGIEGAGDPGKARALADRMLAGRMPSVARQDEEE